MNVARDVNVVGRSAQSDCLRVEADRNIDVIVAGQKQKCIALRAELVVPLDGIDLIDLPLDVGRRHRRTEDGDIRAEVGLCPGCERGRGKAGEQAHHQA